MVAGALITIGAAIGVVYSLTAPDSWAALDGRRTYPALNVQHPIEGAVLPLNMPAPVLLWKTNVAGATEWFAGFKAGDRRWLFSDIQPMWRPPEADWAGIKQAAKGQAIELIVAGREAGRRGHIKARASVHFTVGREAVTEPLFYREVNLPFREAVKDPSKIRWRFGGLDKGVLPPVVLQNLPVCGNCHSFSRNGAYLAMDVDYANDKGSYVITRTSPEMHLATSDIITWDDFRREDGEQTLGLLSQISPDGRYVLSTVKDLSIFMAKPDLAFSQLFFPFLGIIGVYDREARKFFSLPGADDPQFVQSNPTWSPDGQWVVFARNRAVRVKNALAQQRVLLSGDEGEEFLKQTKEYRYDLYRVPFNGGKGGKAEPIRGASRNGRSNYFPKSSPDGRWIVFCQASNYMLLQPDSELFIIPAEGGEARRLGCNLGLMNSWHSWSHDGKWLVFSSKAHSIYTQLYLTRVNERGEASPPVWLAHMVDAGRAANIPEFVDLPPEGIVKIGEKFLDDYSYVRAGDEFRRAGDTENAIKKYRIALSLNSQNAQAHAQLGRLLYPTKERPEAIQHMRTAVQLDPNDPFARFDLGGALKGSGDLTNAIAQLEEALRHISSGRDWQAGALDPKHALPEAVHLSLGIAYQQAGNIPAAETHYREALRMVPDYAEVHYNFGALLLSANRMEEAEEHFSRAVKLVPGMAEAHNCLGIVRQRQNRREEALACFQHAARSDPNNWQAHLNSAFIYVALGQRTNALSEVNETLRIDPGCQPARRLLARLGETTAGLPKPVLAP